MGFVGGEAYLFTINASGEGALDDSRRVWADMLDSIRPVEVAMTLDQGYFKEVREALDLANFKFARFGAALNQTYPTRERITQALTEAGIGTVFADTLEALEDIDPPDRYSEEHHRLVEVHREMVRLDREMGQAVRAGDLAAFGMINGRSAELNGSFVASLPAELCHGAFPGHPLCPSLEPLPGGDYGRQLDGLLRRYEPGLGSAASLLVFPLSLTPEELISITKEMAPRIEALVGDLLSELAALSPPAEFRDDHGRLVDHFRQIGALVDEIAGAAAQGDHEPARRVGPATERIFCETEKSLASEEFKAIVAAHFSVGPPGDCE